MLAYLLVGILRMLGKLHDSLPGNWEPGLEGNKERWATKNVGQQRTLGTKVRWVANTAGQQIRLLGRLLGLFSHDSLSARQHLCRVVYLNRAGDFNG